MASMGPRSGLEIELKLHVPDEQAAAVERALSDRIRSTRTHLRAAYYDTPDHRLGQSGLAWRVRHEGHRWVQTLKASSADADGMSREEHNVEITTRSWPTADPALHDGTPAGAQLAKALKAIAKAGEEPPAERFRTDVVRLERHLKSEGGEVIFAYDVGHVTAGEARAPIRELEIELATGSPSLVIAQARRWTERYGLWIDTINKAQRGSLLADGATQAPVTKSITPELSAEMGLDAAVREMTRACLTQVLRNTAAIANDMYGPEHIHQARVGIRRLRTVVREFAEVAPAIDDTWDERLAEVFSHLGAARDRDVVSLMIPEIVAAGGPPITLPATMATDPVDVARDPALTLLLLEILEFAHGEPQPSPHDDEVLQVVAEQLRRLHKQGLREHERFAELSDDEQHTVRKRVKRLRYTAELTSSLFKGKKVREFLKAMEPAQDALGELNDISVACTTFAEVSKEMPEAWFAVGYMASRRPEAVQACMKPLRKAADAPRYWRKVGRASRPV